MSHTVLIKHIDSLMQEAACVVTGIITAGIKKNGSFSIALSGGSTPKLFFPKLIESSKTIDWKNIHFFLVDERFVPFEDPDSNYRMIREYFYNRIPTRKKNIHPIYTDQDSPGISAERYEKEVKSYFTLKHNEFPRFDLIMLGVGPDGHTASLFPGTKALNETERIAVSVNPPQVKHTRISLTYPAINNARNIIFLIQGKEKAGIVRQIIDKTNESLPASRIKPHDGNLYFFIDKDAGRFLQGTST